ncbi:MAG: hypothetical protein Q8R00_03715 [Candidatus Nanoarchaeia archaeon]|nr:hypothetical protein [Candidatus Nanoarchaeia archaeon]
MADKKEVRDVLEKYQKRFERELDSKEFVKPTKTVSREYQVFREEALEGEITLYEKLCNFSEKIIRITPSKEEQKRLDESIRIAHISVTPAGAVSFGVFASLLLISIGLFVGIFTFLLGQFKIFLPLVLIVGGAVLIKPLGSIPHHLANRWRLAASNQMVLSILYIVMYMRHTSNLEHAIKFASEHIGPPLNLDFKRIFWNIQTGKFVTIKDSLDDYLESWRGWNLEFIEAFHLIQGSLQESNEERRISMLEKALQVMLEGTYDKMLRYAHELQSPITALHMLGVVLPILGLVVFPLIGSFLGGLIKWWHIAILYNLVLPLFVMFMGLNLLSKRPTGYGESDILREHPDYKKFEKTKFMGMEVKPWIVGLIYAIPFFVIGFFPWYVHILNPGFDFVVPGGLFLDYQQGNGPYGAGALILSLFVPMGAAVGIGTYYKRRYEKLIKIKKKMDELEREFAGALFQLGNRVADGIPVESAFGYVAENMKGTPSGEFFARVDSNVRRMGVGVEYAIFDKQRGAIINFPSKLIESSMKVLIQSARKGPMIVSNSLLTISKYVERIRQVNDRLKDLLAEVISSMKSQISFLTPLIAGIVVGVSSMVVTIINKLSTQFATLGGAGEGLGGLAALGGVLNIQDVIPGYQFQIVVGLYVVQIGMILTFLASGIEKGVDRVGTGYSLGKNLVWSLSIYSVICLIGIIIFNLLAGAVGVGVSAGI